MKKAPPGVKEFYAKIKGIKKKSDLKALPEVRELVGDDKDFPWTKNIYSLRSLLRLKYLKKEDLENHTP